VRSEAPAAEVWLTYGGRLPSGTIYCCPGEGETTERPTPLTIDGIVLLPLVRDETSERFRKALTRTEPVHASAVLVGTFFAVENDSFPEAGWGGFGHVGCCPLLVIERVQEFTLPPVPRKAP
jgi:hypothetical protein